MARTYVKASVQWHDRGSAAITAVPFTVAMWAKTDTTTLINRFWAAARNGSTATWFMLQYRGDQASPNKVYQLSRRQTTIYVTSSNTEVTDSGWHHVVAVGAGAASTFVYLDGVVGTEGTDSITPLSIDNTIVGGAKTGGSPDYCNGKIAEYGLWNVVLTQAEITSLANGASPLLVRPNSIVDYLPMIRGADGSTGDENPLKGTTAYTHLANPDVAEHPAMTYPMPTYLGLEPAAGGGGGGTTSPNSLRLGGGRYGNMGVNIITR